MFKQSVHRNQRTKMFKVKHILQLCFLIGVCIWLLYQVQHSRGKNMSDRENTKISDKVKGGNEILNLGRKNLHPRRNGDTEPRLNDDNTTKEAADEETSNSVDGVREGMEKEMTREEKSDAGHMENGDRKRRGEENEDEKGNKENHDQENGGDEGNVKENKYQETPEENEIKETIEEKHVDENDSQELQEKGIKKNEVVQEEKSTEQSSGRGNREDNNEEECLSSSMEERNEKSEVDLDRTTDKTNEVEKEDMAIGESKQNSPNITETEKVYLVDFSEDEKSDNPTIVPIHNQNNTSGLSSEDKESSATRSNKKAQDDQVDSSVSAEAHLVIDTIAESKTEADSNDAVAK